MKMRRITSTLFVLVGFQLLGGGIRCASADPVAGAEGPVVTLTAGSQLPAHLDLSSGTLRLLSDSDYVFGTSVNAAKSNGSVAIDLEPMNATRLGATTPAITLDGALAIGFYTSVDVTSASRYSLVLPQVFSNSPGSVIAPTGANVSIRNINGSVALGGSCSGSTLEHYAGPWLLVKGGNWTVTGNNSAEPWNASVEGGTLGLAKQASLGFGGANVSGVFAPRAGAAMKGDLHMQDGSTLDMADGVVGSFDLLGAFSGPNGGEVTLKFDIDDHGVDQCTLGDVAATNDIKDYVVLNQLTKRLTPGTYTLVTLKAAGKSLMENHFGFKFNGDPADHRNNVTTETLGGYYFHLKPVIDASGNWTAECLQVSNQPIPPTPNP